MELLLVRHAEPVRIASGEVVGPADPGLTERGADQAERLAAWLTVEGVDVIVTSPLRRAIETAAPLATTLGIAPMIVEGITEYDAASDEYIPIEELRELKDERWQAQIEGRWGDADGIDPGVFQAQVVVAVDDLIEQHPGKKVAAVCHGGVINVYLAHVAGVERHLWFHPEYTSISRVRASREGARSVGTINETGHLVATRTPAGDGALG